MKDIMTSIRLTPEIKRELELAVRFLHRDKNWIIEEALQAYLIRTNFPLLASEAKKQSLLASKDENDEADLWEKNVEIMNKQD